MGKRCGRLDPGFEPYLTGEEELSVEQVYDRANLLGVSGESSDMKELLDSDAPGAPRAVDLFVFAAGKELGALVAALEGLDALVFTGGMGEK